MADPTLEMRIPLDSWIFPAEKSGIPRVPLSKSGSRFCDDDPVVFVDFSRGEERDR